jgi:penicillin-binding protein 1B
LVRTAKKIVLTLKRIFQALLIIFGCYILALLATVLWTFEVKLHRWPVFIYGAPFDLRTGDETTKIGLMGRLRRLGYATSPGEVPEPGEWHRSGAEIVVYLRHCPLGGEGIASGPVSLTIDWDRIRSIRLMRSLEEVTHVTLEPELLQVVPPAGYDPELCRRVPLQSIPQLLVDAIVLTEDEHFFSHSGIDFGSIRRALGANWKAGRYVQGGSTISQQLIRMSLLNPEKTLVRKLNEVFLALVADGLYSKETILEAYLNRVYLGQQGAYPVRGVAEGARTIFGKDVGELDPAQCAFIAATIRAPNVIHPLRHPERARDRRNMVLARLFKAGKISRDAYEEAMAAPVRVMRSAPVTLRAGAFVDLVKDRLASGVSEWSLAASGQDVGTSLDPLLQSEAETALKPLGAIADQAHVIVADPRSGDIKAFLTPTGPQRWSGEGADLVGMAPFVVIPSLTPDRQDSPWLTLSSQVRVSGAKTESMTLRHAFTRSPSSLVEQLVASLGPDRVASVLKEFGIRATSHTREGTVSVEPMSPMHMAQSYCLLATLGNAGTLGPGLRIGDASSRPPRTELKRDEPGPAACYLVNYLLKEIDPRTRSEGPAERRWTQPSVFTAMDKEGCWGIAYRDDLLALLRIPRVQTNPKQVVSIVKRLIPPPRVTSETPPPAPDGVVFRKICGDSGLRATSLCPRVIREPFVKGSQPLEWCPLHHEPEPRRPAERK